MTTATKKLKSQISEIEAHRPYGKVKGVSGLVVSCVGLENVAMGGFCEIEDSAGNYKRAEVVGFKNGETLLMPFDVLEGIGPGQRVYPKDQLASVAINDAFLGRVLNAFGEPIDGKGPLVQAGELCPLIALAPSPAHRNAVGDKLDVGVRVLNTFVPVCEGQRLGIFSGSGVGKSVLMSMISRYGEAEVNVIGLIGERGREVKEFIDEQLGEEGLKKSVVIVATGDEPPLMRRQAAYMTMAAAEHFRNSGKKVMLFMDSVTRFAMAQREIGLSAGEPPTTRGYTPSVFSELPRLLERAGPGEGDSGSITAIFTVLVEGGDMDEPVADAVRGIVDGHIVMDRTLAERGHFPAVAVLKSVSRMLPACHSVDENQLMRKARGLISTYEDMEELIRLGAYKKGTDARVDEAVYFHDGLTGFLKQEQHDNTTIDQGFNMLGKILTPQAPPPKKEE